jgi:AcrR family transcriptional regulator
VLCQTVHTQGSLLTTSRAGAATAQGGRAGGRDLMLARLVAHVRANGLPADPSLRRFAADLGTSHRMLTYYFGSRDGLLATVLATLRAEEREHLATLAETWTLHDAALALWSYYTDPARATEHQLLFHVFASAVREPSAYRVVLDSLDDWVTVTTELAVAEGLPPDVAATTAQLLVSGIRGLLMDWLIAADRPRVDAAFGALLDALLPASPSRSAPVR